VEGRTSEDKKCHCGSFSCVLRTFYTSYKTHRTQRATEKLPNASFPEKSAVPPLYLRELRGVLAVPSATEAMSFRINLPTEIKDGFPGLCYF
jgi:hypothetical protein